MKKLCLLFSAVALSGCLHAPQKQAAPAPQPSQVSVALLEKTIVKGKTTKKEITAAFGAPNSVVPNSLLPAPEELAKAKGPLPPIARTTEFWHYWTTPSKKELERAAAGAVRPEVLRVMIFMDREGVAVDYLTETRALDFNK